MRVWLNAFLVVMASVVGCAGAHAQTITGSMTIALKNGESAEVLDLWWVSNCRSMLKGTPEAVILDGPPGVSVSVKAATVIPRNGTCSNRVPGGILVLTANDVEDTSYAALTIRITYPTRDGNRQRSMTINLSLFP